MAPSAANNRPRKLPADLRRTRSPAQISPPGRCAGFDPNLPGNEVLDYDPQRARRPGRRMMRSHCGARRGRRCTLTPPIGLRTRWPPARWKRVGHRCGGRASPPRRISHPDQPPRHRQCISRAGWRGDHPSMIELRAPLFTAGADPTTSATSTRPDAALAAAGRLRIPRVGQRRSESCFTTCQLCRLGLHQCRRMVVQVSNVTVT